MGNRLPIRNNLVIVALSLTLITVMSATASHSGWTARLDIIVWVGIGSAIVGIMLARSLLPAIIAHFFSIIIGGGWAFWVLSRILPKDWTWLTRWEFLSGRVAQWLNIAINGGISYDNEMFILQLGLLVWLAGYASIWAIFRHQNIWFALIPSGSFTLLIFHYAPATLTFYAILFLATGLFLAIRFNLMEQESRWRKRHVFFKSDIQLDFLGQGFLFSALILTMAWFAPTISPEQSTQLFSSFDREWRSAQGQWNRLFADLNYKPDPLLTANKFSQSLSLGGARTLSDDPIMSVQASEGRYWRAAVYDSYDGNGWSSSDTRSSSFGEGNASVSTPFFRNRVPITQTYTFFNDGATVLYALNNPTKLDRPGQVKTSAVTASENQGSSFVYWPGQRPPWATDITFIESDRRIQAKEPYRVTSLFSLATKAQLRADSTNYPQWIESRYTQLPDGIPQRVFDLAEEITKDAANPFDKASAIENYLRTNITYNERIALPPPNRDKVDYILFDLKEAYCDYYATSMIVMLRSQGIPARLAAGYARGQTETLDDQSQAYLVKSKDAHSWVEVFFPSYGWIEFEPTAAQPVIARFFDPNADSATNLLNNTPPEDPIDRVQDVEALGNLPEDTPQPQSVNLPFWGEITIPGASSLRTIIVFAIILGLIIIAWQIFSKFFVPHTSQETSKNAPSTQSIYNAMLKLSAWMGAKKQPWQTSYEHSKNLRHRIPTAEPEIDLITSEYVQNIFSAHQNAGTETRSQLLNAWEKIRPQFYKTIFETHNPLKKIRLPFKW